MISEIRKASIIHISKVYVSEYEIKEMGYYLVNSDFDIFNNIKYEGVFINDVDSVLGELVNSGAIEELDNYKHESKYRDALILRQGQCKFPVEYCRMEEL